MKTNFEDAISNIDRTILLRVARNMMKRVDA
jgi:hypothetical protein